MKKFAISLFALAAISTASFAGAGDNTDTDSPWILNDYIPNAKPVMIKKAASTEALSTGVKTSNMNADFYLNRSQLR